MVNDPNLTKTEADECLENLQEIVQAPKAGPTQDHRTNRNDAWNITIHRKSNLEIAADEILTYEDNYAHRPHHTLR